MSARLPIAQELQIVFHVSRGPGLADSNQPAQFLTDGNGLLVANDDASVVAALLEEFGMKAAKVRRIVSVNSASLLECPQQLFLVRTPQQPALPTRCDLPATMAQSVQQGMGIGIFIEVDS